MLEKIGRIRYSELEKGKYLLRWSESGTDKKKRFLGSYEELERLCYSMSQDLIEQKSPFHKIRLPTLEESLESTLRLSGATPKTKKRWIAESARILVWIQRNYPQVKGFSEITPTIFREVVCYLENLGLTYNGVRLAVQCFRMAWSQAHLDYPFDIGPVPRLKTKAPKPAKEERFIAGEVAEILNYLEAENSPLFPIALFSSLCGLRQLEAAAIRMEDLDLEKG